MTSESRPQLSVITTSYNNPEQLRVTLASVRLQTTPPDHHIIVDSSDKQEAAAIAKEARRAGASYIWESPQGVYSAMNSALREIPDQGLVWFINSSDWLASPASIETMMTTVINSSRGKEKWFVGITVRAFESRLSFHDVGDDGGSFERWLQIGAVGFPHPSVLVPAAFLRSVGGFDERYRFASDYDLGLQLFAELGPPALSDAPAAVHSPGGISYQHPIRHFIEKAAARARRLPAKASLPANAVALLFGARSVLRRWKILVEPPLAPRYRRVFDNPNHHFCGKQTDNWPKCCAVFLSIWASTKAT